MISYFAFYEECIVVKGTNGICVHNLLDGNVYDFKDKCALIIEYLHKGYSINETKNICDVSFNLIQKLINDLTEANLGSVINKKYTSADLIYPPHWLDLISFKSGININRITIVFGTSCNNDCYFCNNKNYLLTSNCFGCYKNISKSEIDNKEILKFLDKVRYIGYNEVNLVGGDIFYDNSFLKDLLSFIYKNSKINIFWGGSKLSCEALKLIKKFKINLFVQIIDSRIKNPEFVNLLNILKSNDIPVSLIIVSDNCKILNDYQKIKVHFNGYIKNLYFNIAFKITQQNDFKKYFMESLPRTSIDDYLHKKMHNSCLYGSISLQLNGNITACPKMVNPAMETIKNINSAFHESNYNKFWNLNKDKIKSCEGCKFRYVCNDCRFIQHKLTADIYDTIDCKYI